MRHRMLRNQGHGFTLVETLVAIGVVGVLLSISIPALIAVRRSGEKAVCQARLGQIGGLYQLYANDHTGLYPNIVPDVSKAPVDLPYWGSSRWEVWPSEQIDFWAYPLRTYIGGEGTETPNGDATFDTVPGLLIQQAEALSCPTVFREHSGAYDFRGNQYFSPVTPTVLSYLHSAALFTDPHAWRGAPAPTPDLDLITQSVRLADVRSPSAKCNLVERRAHHTKARRSIGARGADPVNILACDGHVETRLASSAAEAMEFTLTISPTPWTGNPIPFITTRDGAHGRDW